MKNYKPVNRKPTPRSLSELATQSAQGEDFSYLLGDFLDAFYRLPERAALELEPPSLAVHQEKGSMRDAFLAATAQFLAARQGWPAPSWIFESARYLHRPFFPVMAASFRATLLLESPPEFRSRNLFVTANALSRA